LLTVVGRQFVMNRAVVSERALFIDSAHCPASSSLGTSTSILAFDLRSFAIRQAATTVLPPPVGTTTMPLGKPAENAE